MFGGVRPNDHFGQVAFVQTAFNQKAFDQMTRKESILKTVTHVIVEWLALPYANPKVEGTMLCAFSYFSTNHV